MTKSVHVAPCTEPGQTFFEASDENSRAWDASRIILSNHKSAFTQLVTTSFVSGQV